MTHEETRVSMTGRIAVTARVLAATMMACCVAYPLLILGLGQQLAPRSANGSLVRDLRGEIVGSELLAQRFVAAGYFWPRPSAVDYDASASGGSNLSPTNPELAVRARAIVARLGGTNDRQVPADLVAASGSGLDPHITWRAAEYQTPRVAAARGLPVAVVMRVLKENARKPGGMFAAKPLVNVLRVNLALDALGKPHG